MSGVGVLTAPGVGLGFRLAGLRPREAASPEGAKAALTEMMSEPHWGVILVQESLVPDLYAIARQKLETGQPILVPFPAPSREPVPGDAEAYVAELLRRAVGYRVRLR